MTVNFEQQKNKNKTEDIRRIQICLGLLSRYSRKENKTKVSLYKHFSKKSESEMSILLIFSYSYHDQNYSTA